MNIKRKRIGRYRCFPARGVLVPLQLTQILAWLPTLAGPALVRRHPYSCGNRTALVLMFDLHVALRKCPRLERENKNTDFNSTQYESNITKLYTSYDYFLIYNIFITSPSWPSWLSRPVHSPLRLLLLLPLLLLRLPPSSPPPAHYY